MPNHTKIPMNTESLSEKATRYFTKICGFNREGERIQRMLQDALACHEKIRDTLQIQAVATAHDDFSLEGGVLTIDNVDIGCAAFEQIHRDAVERVYGYVITAGSIPADVSGDDSLLSMVYADAWGTAYVDAARDHLHDTLASGSPSSVLSDSFGPGFYGMPTEEVKNLLRLVDSRVVGVSLTDGLFMMPQKSCAGFYFLVKEGTTLPSAACAFCEGNKQGCTYCNVLERQ